MSSKILSLAGFVCSIGLVLAQAQTYTISTLAGSSAKGFAEGTGATAQFNSPLGLALSGSTLYVADQLNNIIRTVNVSSGAVTTVAGTRTRGFSGNGGAPLSANLQTPVAVAVGPKGFYISDFGNKEVRSVINNVISAYVSRNDISSGFSGDSGNAIDAQINNPYGIVVDSGNIMYLADTGNNRIRKIAADGKITTMVGFGGADYSGDGGLAKDAGLNHPDGVALFGNFLYIADTLNHVIRRVTINPADQSQSPIITVAGNGVRGLTGDGGPALFASLNNPESVAVDANGNLYIADTLNHVIRRVLINAQDPTKSTISTIAGTGVGGYSGDGGTARLGSLNFPRGIAVDAQGIVYVADTSNHVIRQLTPAGAFTGNPPQVNSQGVISASDFGLSRSVAPGSWIEIYGTNLSTVTGGWAASDFNGLKAPTSLSGVRVQINGQDAYVAYVSPGQINALLPPLIAPGLRNVVVGNAAGLSTPIAVNVNTLQPQVYAPLRSLKSANLQYVGAFLPDGKMAFPTADQFTRRARAGEKLTLYGVGFGDVTPSPDPGSVVQSTNTLSFPVDVAFNDTLAVVTEQGLVVNSIGLYYVNVIIPNGVIGDNVTVKVAQNGKLIDQNLSGPTLVTAIGN